MLKGKPIKVSLLYYHEAKPLIIAKSLAIGQKKSNKPIRKRVNAMFTVHKNAIIRIPFSFWKSKIKVDQKYGYACLGVKS